MSYQADLARWFAQLHAGAQPLLLPNPWDVGSAPAAARAGLPGARHDEQRLRRDARAARRLGHARRGAGARGRPRRRHRPAALGRPRERLRRRSRGGRRDRAPGDRGGPRRLLDRGLHAATTRDPIYELPRAVDARRGGGRGRARRPRPPRAHRARGEPRPRPRRPRRHDRAAARLRRGRRRRALRARADADRGHPPRRRGGRPARQRARLSRRARTVSELAAAGVRRVSIGGAFAFAAIDAVAQAARELLDDGTYGFASAHARAPPSPAGRSRPPPEPR